MAKATREHDDEPEKAVDDTSDATQDTDVTTDTDDETTDTEVEGDNADDTEVDGETATDGTPTAKPMAAKPKAASKKTARPAKKSVGNTRRQRLAELESKRKGEQRRRTVILLAICLVLAVAVLAYPVYLFVDDVRLRNTPVAELGVAADAAGCVPVEENAATGNQEHVADGTVVQYAHLPPDSGPHYNTWAPFDTKFYANADRPPVENLVHNLEHGYVVVWYRNTLPAREVKELQAITKTFSGTDPRDKVIAAPWDPAADGGDFPADTNITLARWYADPAAPADTAKQKGIRLSCAAVSGAVVQKFRDDYPATSSPEPNGG